MINVQEKTLKVNFKEALSQAGGQSKTILKSAEHLFYLFFISNYKTRQGNKWATVFARDHIFRDHMHTHVTRRNTEDHNGNAALEVSVIYFWRLSLV